MKNAYEVRGDVTAIIIESKKHGRLETLIDTEDLAKVSEVNAWSVGWNRDTKSFYVKGSTVDESGNRRYIMLHRHILGVTEPNQYIDHVNHDTLLNRKSNLNIVTNAENSQNRRKFTNNSSGYTGVYWDKSRNKWRATIMVDYKRKNLGRFDSIDEAIRVRKSAEVEYFGYKRMIS